MSLKPGYKQTEIGVIPEDWEVKGLLDVCAFKSGKAHEPYISELGEFICVNSKFISTEGRVRKYATKNLSPAMANDILMVMSDLPNGKALAKAYLAEEDNVLAVNQRVCSLTSRGAYPKFLFYILNRNKYFLNFDDGVNQTHLLNKVFSRCRISVPNSVKEQKAIAEALSDVDALIDSLEALLTKKRNIKTGVMQELLTGRTRLPEFSDDWHEVRLEDFADCFDHLRIPLNESERLTRIGDYPYCGANGVLGFIDKYLIDDEMVLIAEDGGYFDEFATRPIAYKMSGKYWVNNHAHVLKAKPSQDNNYLYYSLVHKDVTPYLASGTRAKLNKSEMWKIEIRAPKSKSEQEAIAAVLSDIDDEIEALEKRLAKTRDLKQGMAQELLTGRTRLV